MLENYTVIDLEMTGLNAKYHKILEVAAARVREKQVIETISILIHQELPLEEEIIRLTGINDKMLKDALSEDEVLAEFFAFLGEDILVGHNVIFDYGFLKQAAVNRRVSFERKAVDTLKIARRCLCKESKKDLETLCQLMGITMEHHHRALDDVMATQLLYEKLEKEFEMIQTDIFEPKPLLYKAKKQTPATERQKKHLKELADYHKINLNLSWNTLTRNEASRQVDKIIAAYGKMKKN